MKWNILTVLLMTSVFFAACQGAPPNDKAGDETFKNLDVAAFKAKMEDENTVVLDVRTPRETAQGMIEGAIELDIKAPDFAEQVAQLDKDKTYLVYCRSGRRSVTACNIMAEQGFPELYNLLGGYLEWQQ